MSNGQLVAGQESERRLRDLLAGKKPPGGGGGGGNDAAAVAPSSVGNKKSVAARGSQMQLFQARALLTHHAVTGAGYLAMDAIGVTTGMTRVSTGCAKCSDPDRCQRCAGYMPPEPSSADERQ